MDRRAFLGALGLMACLALMRAFTRKEVVAPRGFARGYHGVIVAEGLIRAT